MYTNVDFSSYLKEIPAAREADKQIYVAETAGLLKLASISSDAAEASTATGAPRVLHHSHPAKTIGGGSSAAGYKAAFSKSSAALTDGANEGVPSKAVDQSIKITSIAPGGISKSGRRWKQPQAKKCARKRSCTAIACARLGVFCARAGCRQANMLVCAHHGCAGRASQRVQMIAGNRKTSWEKKMQVPTTLSPSAEPACVRCRATATDGAFCCWSYGTPTQMKKEKKLVQEIQKQMRDKAQALVEVSAPCIRFCDCLRARR